jgi:hypothetical protein
LPQVTIEGAKRLCDRLHRLSENNLVETGGSLVKLAFGLAELALDKEEKSSDLIDRATAFIKTSRHS